MQSPVLARVDGGDMELDREPGTSPTTVQEHSRPVPGSISTIALSLSTLHHLIVTTFVVGPAEQTVFSSTCSRFSDYCRTRVVVLKSRPVA